MSELINLSWKAPGPVTARFMTSAAPVQIINGPIGSGKTTAAMVKGIRIAARQQLSKRHRAPNSKGEIVPLRRVKMTVVRDTYRQLWKTTIPSWLRRIPQEAGEWNGAVNAPASHHIRFEIADGSLVDFIAEFAAIGEMDVEDFCRGYEPTFWYLNELDLLSRELMAFALGRAGRYPEAEDGGPSWYGVLADCNAPEFESWVFEDIFSRTPAELAALGVELFVQPGGRDAGAENLENLVDDYYVPKIGQAEWYIARMIDNKPGYSRSGKPIFPEFNDRLHVATAELEPIPGLPLHIGLDAGLDPSAIIGQKLGDGRWLIVDELTSEHGTGALRFARKLAELLHDRYPAWSLKMIRGWADPSAAWGVDQQEDEQSWLDLVAHHVAIAIRPAPTNNPTERREAVRRPLNMLVDGKPGLLLSPRCKVLRRGFNNGYRFRKLQVPGAERFGDEAEKNAESHPHDALQYLLLGGGEHIDIHERRRERSGGAPQRQAEDTWGQS